MTNSLADVSHLNNSAVSSLAQGDLKRAHELLNSALRDFYQDIEEHPVGRLLERDHHVNGTRHTMVIRPVPLHPALCGWDWAFSADNPFQIYNRAFFVPLSHLDQDEVAAVLLYNFGLVLLKRGIAEGKRKLLRKALKIYGMAVDLLQDEAFTSQDNQQVFHLLELAVWANQGFIHFYNLDYLRVRSCKDHIKNIVNNGPRLCSYGDMTLFIQTVMYIEMFGLPKDASPAA